MKPAASESRALADAILALLVAGRVDAAVTASTPGAVLAAARQHVAVVRVDDVLGAAGIVAAGISEAARAERDRVARSLTLVARAGRALDDAGIPYVFPKAFQHYPDMGHDIDLLAAASRATLGRVLQSTLDGRLTGGSPAHWFAGKAEYAIPAFDSSIEVHAGRLGHLGEHRGFAREAIEHRATATAGDVTTFVMASEHHLPYQALQRMYGHFSLRASDVAATVRTIGAPGFGWDEAQEAATRMGILPGLREYLAAVDAIVRGAKLEMPAIPAGLRPQHRAPVWFDGRTYRVGTANGAALRFARKLAADVAAGRLVSGARVVALPVVAAVTTAHNVWSRGRPHQPGGPVR